MRWVVWGGLAIAAVVAAVFVLGEAPVEVREAPAEVAVDEPAAPAEAAPVVEREEAAPRRLVESFFGVTSFATFSGRVVAADEGGAPLSGAVVWHVPDETTLAATGFDVDVLATIDGEVESVLPRDRMTSTVTDADGRFTLRAPSLPIPGGRRWPDVPMLVVEHPDMATRPFRCAGFTGGAEAAYDAGALAVQTGATVTGRVTTPGGARPADAVVSIWSSSWEEVWSRAVDVKRWGWLDYRRDFFRFTDAAPAADGRFELRGVVAGLVGIRAEHPRLVPSKPQGRHVDRGSTWDVGEIALSSGEALDVLVTDEATDEPLADVRVALLRPGSSINTCWEDQEPLRAARTGAEGLVSFEGIGDGPYVVSVERTGFVGTRIGDVFPARERRLDVDLQPAIQVAVHVAPYDRTALDAGTLQAWGVVRGDTPAYVPFDVEVVGKSPYAVVYADRYFDEVAAYARLADGRRIIERSAEGADLSLRAFAYGVPGRVVDAEGRPVAGASVILWSNDPLEVAKPWYAVQETSTTEDGRFVLHRTEFRSAGLALRAVTSDGRVSAVVSFDDLGAGRPLRVVAGGELKGRLVDTRNEPLSGVHVRVVGDGMRLAVVTDEDGAFEVRGLPAGFYDVRAEPGARADVSISPGVARELELVARTKPTIRGQVREGDEAVPLARVFAFDSDDAETVSTQADVNGFFELELPTPGGYRVGAQADDGALTSLKHVTVEWRQSVDVDLRFGVLTTRGYVDGHEPGMIAQVLLAGTDRGRATPVDRDGRFVFDRLPNAAVEFAVAVDGMKLLGETFERPPDSVTLVTDDARVLDLAFGPRWWGMHVTVEVEPKDGPPIVRELSIARGNASTLRFDSLRAQTYRVTVTGASSWALPAHRSLRRSRDHEQELDVDLESRVVHRVYVP